MNSHLFKPITKKPFEKADWLYLIIGVSIALLIRVIYLWFAHNELWFQDPIVDSYNYHLWAQRILSGDFLGEGPYIHSPFYPFFLALAYLIGGINSTNVAAFQLLVFGPAACGLLFLLGRQLFDRKLGLIAALAEAGYGMAIFFEANLLNTSLIHLLNLAMLLSAYWAIGKKQLRYWLVPGIFMGLSIINRPNLLPFLFIVGLWLFLYYQQEKKPKAAIKPFLVLGLCVAFFILPLTIRNYIVLKEFMPTVGHSGIMFYLGNKHDASGYHVPEGDLGLSSSEQLRGFKHRAEQQLNRKLTYTQSSRFWAKQARKEIANDFSKWQQLVLKKLFNFFNHYEYTTSLSYYFVKQQSSFFKWPWIGFGLICPLALLGMIYAARQWRRLLPLYGMVVTYLFSNLLLLVSAEYRYAIMPAFFIFAASGSRELIHRAQQKKWSSLVMPTLLLILFGVLSNITMISVQDKNYHLATTYSNMAAAYYNKHEYIKAADYYGKAVDLVIVPSNRSWLLNFQGEAWFQANDNQKALTILKQAYHLAPQDVNILTNYANVLTDMGAFDEAIVMRKKAIASAPHDALGYYNLGITYLWIKNEKLADQTFRRAIDLGLNQKYAENIINLKQRILNKERNPAGNQ